MMRLALISLLLAATPEIAFADDEIFERDLSTPFLRDDDDRFLRDRDLPGPLRKSWPYAGAPERPFKAVEARRACHARALFEISGMGGEEASAIARLESTRKGPLLYAVSARYAAVINDERREVAVTCEVSSQAVRKISVDVEK